MKEAPLIEEPLFITEEIETEMTKGGYVFEPPKHVSADRLYELPGFENLSHSDEKADCQAGASAPIDPL